MLRLLELWSRSINRKGLLEKMLIASGDLHLPSIAILKKNFFEQGTDVNVLSNVFYTELVPMPAFGDKFCSLVEESFGISLNNDNFLREAQVASPHSTPVWGSTRHNRP